MRLAAATVMALVVWTACSVAGSVRQVQFEFGKPFSLRAGEFAQSTDATLSVGFEGVTVDSRCPKGEQCVWAGDASARVWLQQGSGPRVTRELRTAMGAAQAATAFGHNVRLVRLDPNPVTGKTVAKGDYVATLWLSLGSSDVSDR